MVQRDFFLVSGTIRFSEVIEKADWSGLSL